MHKWLMGEFGVVFSRKGAGDRFRRPLREAQIHVTLTTNKIRISPSVYNDMSDIERILKILCA
jgi:selenocysteine lyase/cysteine desulfurase